MACLAVQPMIMVMLLVRGQVVFLEHKAKVLEAIPTSYDVHPHFPLIVPVHNGLDEMRLAVRNEEKHTIVL
jgi:phenylacetate-coenzyme A ligase PaaK-like adenylate-forming protein